METHPKKYSNNSIGESAFIRCYNRLHVFRTFFEKIFMRGNSGLEMLKNIHNHIRKMEKKNLMISYDERNERKVCPGELHAVPYEQFFLYLRV